MKLLFICLSILSSSASLCQDSFESFSGVIVGDENSMPLDGAKLRFSEFNLSVTTDIDGRFAFRMKTIDQAISIYSPGYDTLKTSLSSLSQIDTLVMRKVVKLEVDFDFSKNEEGSYVPEDIEEIFTIVEDQPEFPGGMSAFYRFIGERIRFPSEALRQGIEGRVFVQFIVDKDGSLKDIKTVHGIGAGCDEEAERVLGLVPKFKPGMQRGRPVRVRMVLPIAFKIGNGNLTSGPALASNKIRENTSPFVMEYDFPTNAGFLGLNAEFTSNLSDYIASNLVLPKEEIGANRTNNAITFEIYLNQGGEIFTYFPIHDLSPAYNLAARSLIEGMPTWKVVSKAGHPKEILRKFVNVRFPIIEQKLVEQAEKDYEKAIEEFSKGNYEKALLRFEAAIQLNPTDIRYKINSAISKAKLSRIEEACLDLKTLVGLDEEIPSFINAYCK